MSDSRGTGKKSVVWRIAPYVLLVVLALAAAASVAYVCPVARKTSQDFGMRWITIRTLLNGENIYQMKLKGKPSPYLKGIRRGKFAYFDPQYLPSSLVVMLPYAAMPYRAAVDAWLITNLAATGVLLVVTFLLFRGRLSTRTFLIVALLFLCNGAFRIAVTNGQLCIVALAFLVLALFFWRKQLLALAGLCLAFSLLKYHLVLPFLVVFLFRRKGWIVLAICGLIHSVWHLGFCLLVKASPIGIFRDVLELNLRAGRAHEWFDVWSAFRWLQRSYELAFNPPLAALPVLILVTACLGFLFWKDRRRSDQLALFSVIGVFTLFAAYHRVYDSVCLLFPAVWIAGSSRNRIQAIVAGLGLLMLLFFYPLFRYEWLKDSIPRRTTWMATAPALYIVLLCIMNMLRLDIRSRLTPVCRLSSCPRK